MDRAQRTSTPSSARFRNAVQAAAVWGNQKQNQAASGRILARYAPVDAKGVLAKMTRFKCDAASAALGATLDRPLRP